MVFLKLNTITEFFINKAEFTEAFDTIELTSLNGCNRLNLEFLSDDFCNKTKITVEVINWHSGQCYIEFKNNDTLIKRMDCRLQ